MPRERKEAQGRSAVPGDTVDRICAMRGDDDQDVTAIIDRMLSVCERVPEPLRMRMWSLLVANEMGFQPKRRDRATNAARPDHVWNDRGRAAEVDAIADASGGPSRLVSQQRTGSRRCPRRQIGDYSVLRWDWPPAPAKLMPEL